MFWFSGSLFQRRGYLKNTNTKYAQPKVGFRRSSTSPGHLAPASLSCRRKNARGNNGRWCIGQTCLFLQQHAQHPSGFFMGLHAGGEQVGGGFVVGFVHSGEQLAAGADHGFLAFH